MLSRQTGKAVGVGSRRIDLGEVVGGRGHPRPVLCPRCVPHPVLQVADVLGLPVTCLLLAELDDMFGSVAVAGPFLLDAGKSRQCRGRVTAVQLTQASCVPVRQAEVGQGLSSVGDHSVRVGSVGVKFRQSVAGGDHRRPPTGRVKPPHVADQGCSALLPPRPVQLLGGVPIARLGIDDVLQRDGCLPPVPGGGGVLGLCVPLGEVGLH